MLLEISGICVNVDAGVLNIRDLSKNKVYTYDSNKAINLVTLEGQEYIKLLSNALRELSKALHSTKLDLCIISNLNNVFGGMGKVSVVDNTVNIDINIKLVENIIGYGLEMLDSKLGLYRYSNTLTTDGYTVDSGVYLGVNSVGNVLGEGSMVLLDTRGNIYYYSNIGLNRICNLNNRDLVVISVESLDATELQLISVLDKKGDIIACITVVGW